MTDRFESRLQSLLNDFQQLAFPNRETANYYRTRAATIEQQLQNQWFRVTIVGEYSAGKSTFLNALIGRDILPHARTETTATLTYIYNVPQTDARCDTLTVHFREAAKAPLTLRFAEDPHLFKTYTTTESGDHRVADEIERVDVFVSFRDIDLPVVFIDTPGMNGVAPGHRELTLREIERSHASICLFHLRSASSSSMEFLRLLFKYQRSFLFVLNFIDHLNATEGETAEDLLTLLQEQVRAHLLGEDRANAPAIRAFGISALKALAAKDASIPRLHDDDPRDLTPDDRQRLWEQSGFAALEGHLWQELLHGERLRIFRDSLLRSFVALLQESGEESQAVLDLAASKQDEAEAQRNEERLAAFEARFQRNWERVENYIDSRESGLEREAKDDVRRELETLEQQAAERIHAAGFDEFQEAMKNKTYERQFENGLMELSAKFGEALNRILEEVYQSSVLRVLEYTPSVDVQADGRLVYRDIQFEPIHFARDEKAVTLRQKRIDAEASKAELLGEKEEVERSLGRLQTQLAKRESALNEHGRKLSQELQKLGREPEAVTYTVTKYREVARAKWSPFRLFGSSTKTESYSATETDTSARDAWRKEQAKIQSLYAEQGDRLRREATELKLSKKQLEMRKAQFPEKWQALEDKLAEIEADTKRRRIEYEEIVLKAKNEFLRAEKKKLLAYFGNVLENEIAPGMLQSLNANIRDNMKAIRGRVGEYYNKAGAEYRQRIGALIAQSAASAAERQIPYAQMQTQIGRLLAAAQEMEAEETR